MKGECRKVKSKCSCKIPPKRQRSILRYPPNAEPHFARKSKHAVSKLFPEYHEQVAETPDPLLLRKGSQFLSRPLHADMAQIDSSVLSTQILRTHLAKYCAFGCEMI